MTIQSVLTTSIQDFISKEFQKDIQSFEFQQTRKEFKGDITLVVFPLLRHIKTNPAVLGEKIGEYLKANVKEVNDFNVIK